MIQIEHVDELDNISIILISNLYIYGMYDLSAEFFFFRLKWCLGESVGSALMKQAHPIQLRSQLYMLL